MGYLHDCVLTTTDVIRINHPAIMREIPHFDAFPAFLLERPTFVAVFLEKKSLKSRHCSVPGRHFVRNSLGYLHHCVLATTSECYPSPVYRPADSQVCYSVQVQPAPLTSNHRALTVIYQANANSTGLGFRLKFASS